MSLHANQILPKTKLCKLVKNLLIEERVGGSKSELINMEHGLT